MSRYMRVVSEKGVSQVGYSKPKKAKDGTTTIDNTGQVTPSAKKSLDPNPSITVIKEAPSVRVVEK